MNNWSSGYVADIGYTYGYYSELNPLRIRLAFLNAGLVPPEVGTACELGFGQGMSANLHAAASVVRWSGTDFNPSQAAFARELAQASAAEVALFDQAFDEFCQRADLPEFDFIGLHGIWSWISDANRSVIVDFIRRKLKVGGVLYISYNTQPGWAAMVPMRDLLTEHAEVLGADGAGIVSRIDSALGFAEQLLAAKPQYALTNPSIAQRIEQIKGQDRNYLAHEYFNRDWSPMSFARMGQWLGPAKLQFACSANYLDALDTINLSAEQQQLLAGIPDTGFRQTVRDFCVNQQFRKDYWVKGVRSLSVLEQAERLRAERLVLVQPRQEVSLKVNGSLGEASLQQNVYGPVLDVLADHQPKTIGQIEQALAQLPAGASISFVQLVQVAVVLSGSGAVLPAQSDEAIARASACCAALNRHLMNKARSSADINYLASPVTGGAISVGRFAQLFLLARSQGGQAPADWAQFVWQLLEAQGQRIVKEGQALQTAAENLAELSSQAEEFALRRLPLLVALGVTD